MKAVVAVACVLLIVTVVMKFATGEKTKTVPTPIPMVSTVEDVPASLLNQNVTVYFRGSDDIDFPKQATKSDAPTMSLAMTLRYLSGRVVEAKGGWLALGDEK